MELYKHMQPIEVAIVSHIVSALYERGFKPVTANDGDLDFSGNLHTVLEVVNSVADSTINFLGPKGELPGIRFITGNGCDIASDWAGREDFMDIVDTALSAFGDSQDLYRWGFWARWDQGDGPLVPNMPEVYSKRVDEHGDLKVGEVTIKPWMGREQTVLEFAKWVDDFLAALNDHPARNGDSE